VFRFCLGHMLRDTNCTDDDVCKGILLCWCCAAALEHPVLAPSWWHIVPLFLTCLYLVCSVLALA
jgi:hypothetical protein